MAVKASELDAATLKRLGLADTGGSKRPSRAGSGGWNLACVACGFRPTSDKSANNHTATEDHARYQSAASTSCPACSEIHPAGACPAEL